MSEEDRAQKEIEFSYIMLNIYKSTNLKREEQIKPESVKVKAFIVSLDIIASETLKLMRLTL